MIETQTSITLFIDVDLPALFVYGVAGLLIAMKECGFIDWAWGWVLAPLWMCATTITVLVLVTILTEV